MISIRLLPAVLIFSICVQHTSVANKLSIQVMTNDSIVQPGASLQLVSSGFKFTEGPATDKHGNVFFTDQPNDKIWKYDTDGKLSVFLDHTGRSNGMYFDSRGDLFSCADANNEIWKFTPGGKSSVVFSGDKEHRLNGPNDLWIKANGDIYFTDPFYARDYWPEKRATPAPQVVYYLPKGKQTPVAVATDLVKPNGIVGTPDGKFLYVADIGGKKTYRFRIQKDGSLSDKQLVVEQGSDGMTIDNQGNIYLTGKGVTVYDKDGKFIRQIDVPANWTANVCFGGKDRNILFITASES
ncbi:MAG TPA: SMP-30/gluconolactonase/LRE family protein, partial [Chitinophagaceae bacterium]|nr:SMP-30/gluconolactonase/LRE family protein [Chitinophagaceae bacterium]